jgi:hypothetical protein
MNDMHHLPEQPDEPRVPHDQIHPRLGACVYNAQYRHPLSQLQFPKMGLGGKRKPVTTTKQPSQRWQEIRHVASLPTILLGLTASLGGFLFGSDTGQISGFLIMQACQVSQTDLILGFPAEIWDA